MNLRSGRLYMELSLAIEIKSKMKEAEDIILAKRFYELTPAELDMVKEFASNEEDYDAMRWFLERTKTSFANEKIEPSKNLRRGVMAHLNQQPAQKTIWLNGAAAFLFPREKKFYQYPAFQLAAVGLLLVGFVMMYDGTLKDQNGQLAINDTAETDQGLKEELRTEPALGESTSSGNNESLTNGLADKDVSPSAPVEGPYQRLLEAGQSGPGDDSNANPDDQKQLSVAEESRTPGGYGATAYDGESTVVDELAEEDNYYRGGVDKNADGVSGKIVTLNESNSAVFKKENDGRFEINSASGLGNAAAGGSIVTSPAAPADNGTVAFGTTTVTGNITVLDSEESKEKDGKEGERYLTATTEAVYGDTASRNNTGSDEPGSFKPDVDQPAAQMTVGDSKELKALFFSIK